MHGIKTLAHRWVICVTLGGDYVEKLQSNFVRGPLFLCFSHYLLINPRKYINKCKQTVVYTRVNDALHIENCKNYKKAITHQHIA